MQPLVPTGEGAAAGRRALRRGALAATWLALAAATGCYRGGAASGDCEVLCMTDTECPSGLVCGAGGRCVGDRAATCAGLGADGGPGDGAADGPGCGTHDEDDDGLRDGCDPCPHDDPFPGDDGDGDGVAIGCDPDDFEPGDTIALFDGLPGGTTYEASSGWLVDVNQHWVATAGTPDLAWLTWSVPGIGNRFKLTAEVEVRSRGAAMRPWLGLGRGLGGASASAAAGFVCRIDLTPITATPVVRATILPITDQDAAPANAEVPLSARYSLNYESWPNASQCRFTTLAGPENDLISSASGNVSEDLGLIVHGAELVVHWIQVTRIDRP